MKKAEGILRTQNWPIAIVPLLLLIPYVLPSNYVMNVMIMSFIMATLSSYFNVPYRTLGYCNFGYAAFYGAGAYFSALIAINYGVPPAVAILGAGLFGALLGLCYSLPILRLRGFHYVAMTSWFFAEVMRLIVIRAVNITRGMRGLWGIPQIFSGASMTTYYYIGLFIFLVSVAICYKLINSKTGLLWFAIGEDQDLTDSLGINALKYKISNLVISTFFAGLVGGFYAHYMGIIHPSLLDWVITLYVLIFALVGGSNSILGPIVGTFALKFLEETLRPIGEVHPIIFGSLLIVTMLFFPKGLIGIYDTIKAKVAPMTARNRERSSLAMN
jgi:branched-chain amino acid transport system permease protein